LLDRRDPRAFRALYRANTPAMLGVVMRMLGGRREDAEDVVQEAWLVAAEKLAGFRGDSSLRTWLVGIAVHCARSRLRRHAAAAAREVDLAGVVELPGPPPLAESVPAVDLERAIAALPDGYREVLILHDVFGYTHAEIGLMLGVETGTSKSQLHQARASLRRRLGGKGNANHERRYEQGPE
jgi:RNA polymerase sigma-70 factor (ECF subfamily)